VSDQASAWINNRMVASYDIILDAVITNRNLTQCYLVVVGIARLAGVVLKQWSIMSYETPWAKTSNRKAPP